MISEANFSGMVDNNVLWYECEYKILYPLPTFQSRTRVFNLTSGQCKFVVVKYYNCSRQLLTKINICHSMWGSHSLKC